MDLFTQLLRPSIVARSIYVAGAAAIGALGSLCAPALADGGENWHLAPCWHQDGQASYYGRHWNGHRTSSGAVFDPLKLTAAHASLPLGTRLLVTSAISGQSVVVTVNDREPDHGHRIIDLSPAAARRLGMIGSGVAEVVVTRATETDLQQSETSEEVAEAPDAADDQEVATPRSVHHVSHVPHGQPHRRLARR